MPRIFSLGLVFCAVVFTFTHSAYAATIVSGTIDGDVTWTKEESPYIANGISIPSGSSLTLLPGTIVRLSGGAISVMGTLTSGGAGETVTITSAHDDGGATPPLPGDWRGIIFSSGSTGSITNTAITYGGATFNASNGDIFRFPLINNQGGTVSITNSFLIHSGNNAVEQSSGTMTVSGSTIDTASDGIQATGGMFTFGGNTFINIARYDVYAARFSNFQNNGGNTGNKGIYAGNEMTGSHTWGKDNIPYIGGGSYIHPGASLTILPGAIIKYFVSGAGLSVGGTLTVGSPTSTEKVIITSMNDDTVGGDTNGDGDASTPQAGDWQSMTFGSGVVNIANTIIRYGGAITPISGGSDYAPMIKNFGSTVTIDRVELAQSQYSIIDQSGGTLVITDAEIFNAWLGIVVSGGQITIHNSSIHDNADYAIYNQTANIINATNNWWGSATGPTHPSNPFGAGDKVSDNVNFGEWLTEAPGEDCIPGTTGCYSNVLFLPGLQASRLYEEDAFGFEHRRWEPRENLDVKNLFLDEEGKHPASPALVDAKIYTRDVVDEAYPEKFGLLAPNIYESFIAQMNAMVAVGTINNWKAIPYDWRLAFGDILASGKKDGQNISYMDATSTPYIIQELRRLAAESKTKKVTIVAHSNGGLLAKALLQQLGNEDAAVLVDKVIFVASPQSGTPQAIGALLHGYKLGLPTKVPLFLSPDTARALAKNFPGAYTLLPSDAYFRDVRTPVATFDGTSFFVDEVAQYGSTIENRSELSSFLLNSWSDTLRNNAPYEDTKTPAVLNSIIQNSSSAVHETIDGWVPPSTIKIYQIAGWGIDTLATIHYKEKKHLLGDSTWNYGLGLTQDGDGTVVVPSALQLSTSTTNVSRWWVDLAEYNDNNLDREHADIFEVDGVRDFIDSIITNADTIPASYLSPTRLTPTNQNKRLRFFLYSPPSLELYDAEGRHTGISPTTGLIDHEISGAYYREFGEVKYITAPASTTLHLVLNGQASGSFSLEIQEVIGDTIVATTTFVDIPSSTSTIVTMDFTDGTISNASALRIDTEGDGAIDFTLLPRIGAEVFLDSTPPEAMIAFNPATLGLLVTGLDTQSVPTVSASGTIYTVVDAMGNMLQLNFSQLLTDAGKQSKVAIESLRYDNETTFFLGTTTLKYEWALDKEQMVKMLNQEARVGKEYVHAHYSAKDERTTITAHVNGISTTSVTPGLVVVRLRTNEGIMKIEY